MCLYVMYTVWYVYVNVCDCPCVFVCPSISVCTIVTFSDFLSTACHPIPADWSHSFTSFLSPQWGGLVVYNHNTTTNNDAKLSVDMYHVMPTFITQLKKLLGLPELVIKVVYSHNFNSVLCIYIHMCNMHALLHT